MEIKQKKEKNLERDLKSISNSNAKAEEKERETRI